MFCIPWKGKRGMKMHRGFGKWRRPVPCLGALGAVMVAAGLVLLFACVPGWAWAALAGLGLIAAGYVLLNLAQRGR